MRLALLSDIHGNLIALEAVLADLEAVGGADTVWVLGDLAAFGSRPTECVQRIMALREERGKDHFKIIGGNTDRYLVTGERFPMRPAKDEEKLDKMRATWRSMGTILQWNVEQLGFAEYEYLGSILKKELALKVQDYGWVIGFHAIPGDDEAFLKADTPESEVLDMLLDREGSLAVYGHTHVQLDRTVGTWRIVNPGSIGSSVTHPGQAQWALLTFDNGSVSVDLRSVPFDIDSAIADLDVVGYPVPEWIVGALRPTT